MSNNLNESHSRSESGPKTNYNSQCTGREANPAGSPSGLTNGNGLKTVAELFFTKRTYYLYENKEFPKRAHPNAKVLPSGEIIK
jgi:hypothetical protein